MIDTHTHLDLHNFHNDREDTCGRFFNAGGKAIVNIILDLEKAEKSISVLKDLGKIYFAAGHHPSEKTGSSKKIRKSDLKTLEELFHQEKIVAIGEIGLDYFWENSEEGKENQKETFSLQVDFAQKKQLPVIVHCREGYADLYDILNSKAKSEKSRVVIHCYGGNLEITEKFLEMPHLYFSFAGNITYPKEGAEIFDVIRSIPLERIMVETDCPFLAPMPHRGERNEPLYVKNILEKLAEIKGISYEEAEKATDQNAIEFFNLKL